METAIGEHILERFFLELEQGDEVHHGLAQALRGLHRDNQLQVEKVLTEVYQKLARKDQ